jgi:hypothetical protein
MAQKVSHRTVGSLWLARATFTVGGAVTDPTNLTVRVQDAAGVETILLNNVLVSTLSGVTTPIKKVSTGIFEMNPGVTLSASGYWFCKFEGTGTAVATIQDEVIVDPDEFTSNAGLSIRALVSLPETKAYLRQKNLAVDDLDLVRTMNAVSERAHAEAGREFKPITAGAGVVRLFAADPLVVERRQVFVGDLASAPTLVRILDKDGVAVATVAAGDYILYPRNREAWEPIQRIEFTTDVTKLLYGYAVEITGTWGFPLVPENVRQAVLEGIAYSMDVDAEHYRQDLAPTGAGTGANVIVMQYGAQRMLSMPASSLAVLWGYRTLAYG